jgi:putative salt-induced outer membrane protein YdiY
MSYELDYFPPKPFDKSGWSSKVLNYSPWRKSLYYNSPANIDYQLHPNSKFRQTLESTMSMSGENSSLLSRSSITAKIADSLSMRFNFVLKYNSKPEGVLESLDSETSASLV